MTTTGDSMQDTFTPADDDKHIGRSLTVESRWGRPGDIYIGGLAERVDGSKYAAACPVAHAQVPALALTALTHGGWGPGKVVEDPDHSLHCGEVDVDPGENPEALIYLAAGYLALAEHIKAARSTPPPDPAVERAGDLLAEYAGKVHDGEARGSLDEYAARIVAAVDAVRESGAQAPEPKQSRFYAIGDIVRSDDPEPPMGTRATHRPGDPRTRTAEGWERDVPEPHLPPIDWATFSDEPVVILASAPEPEQAAPVTGFADGGPCGTWGCVSSCSAEREADAAGENGAQS